MNKYIAPEYKNEAIETEDIVTVSIVFNEEDQSATVTGNLADLIG